MSRAINISIVILALAIGKQWSTGPLSLPTNALLMFASGSSCPLGTTEWVGQAGKGLIFTTIAAANVGTTGGNDNITPTGTNSSSSYTPAGTIQQATFTGSALATHNHGVGTYDNAAITAGTPSGTNSASTFTGTPSSVIVNHLHTLATGTGATGNFSQVLGTVDTSSGGTGGTPTQTALGTLSGNPTAGGAASYTPAGTINTAVFTGNVLASHDHTISGASSSDSAGTPAGTINSQTFTGTGGTVPAQTFLGDSFDNRSAFVRVIVCRVN